MDTTDIDWNLYRAFLAVMHEGSLSAAARALGSTQPSVGRHIAALEEALVCIQADVDTACMHTSAMPEHVGCRATWSR